MSRNSIKGSTLALAQPQALLVVEAILSLAPDTTSALRSEAGVGQLLFQLHTQPAGNPMAACTSSHRHPHMVTLVYRANDLITALLFTSDILLK